MIPVVRICYIILCYLSFSYYCCLTYLVVFLSSMGIIFRSFGVFLKCDAQKFTCSLETADVYLGRAECELNSEGGFIRMVGFMSAPLAFQFASPFVKLHPGVIKNSH